MIYIPILRKHYPFRIILQYGESLIVGARPLTMQVQKKLGEVDRLRGVIKDREKKIQKLTPGREQILVEKVRSMLATE